ncbi:MAG: hemerythrin domain-containing protein [Candidatus Zixiibacteriota bacterium]
MFPALVNKGIPQEGGPIAVMLHEHEMGRMHVRGMSSHVEAAADGNRMALEAFASHAEGYVQLLRQHILKEDRILFPMDDRVMNEDDTREVLRQFDQVEKEEMGTGTHERFLKIAEKLAERYDVSKAQLLPHLPSDSGCCHHKH